MEDKAINRLIRQAQNIKAQLAMKGWTLSAIDREYNLPGGTAGDTLRNPNRRGEEAIAAALDVQPQSLWSLRYRRTTGQRLSPQPSQNYERPPTILQRRKVQGSQT